MIRKVSLLLLVPIMLFPACAYALSMDELLTSSAKHYPKIAESMAAIEAQTGKIQSAQGAFDWELNQKAHSRTTGYYNGDYIDSQITRRLSDSATRIYGGYRVSNGEFPVYEEQNQTLTGGEFNAGISLALWRDRLIDEDRFAYKDANLELQQKEIDLLLTRVSVQYDAMRAYIEWVAAGRALQIAEGLLNLGLERQKGFEKRVEKGDLAAIYLTENQQYIAKRQADVNNAQRLLYNKAAQLSLYWRDGQGNMLHPQTEDLPTEFPQMAHVAIDRQGDIERARKVRPELMHLDTGLKREKNKLLLGENRTLPKVDLIAQSGRDIGGGANRFTQTESKIGLNISIPLQQNVGKGQMLQSRSRITQLEQQQRLLHDKIETEIHMAANNFHAAALNVTQAEKEVSASIAMEQAERERFKNGASDFFLVNIREERTADAQRKQVSSILNLWSAIADYYIASFQTDQLLPETM